MKKSKHIKWWRSLSEMKKWNMTINYTIHWAELDDSQILKLYESKDKVKTHLSLWKAK
jgi:transposase